MDLLNLAERTGIGPRRLRYAIYHALMPAVPPVDRGKGAVRHFTEFEAFGIALAALLLDAGLKRDVVGDCIDAVVRRYGPETPQDEVPLYRAFIGGGPATLELADRRFVRVRTGASRGWPTFDTGWMRLRGVRNATAELTPVVLLTANLSSLRNAIRGPSQK